MEARLYEAQTKPQLHNMSWGLCGDSNKHQMTTISIQMTTIIITTIYRHPQHTQHHHHHRTILGCAPSQSGGCSWGCGIHVVTWVRKHLTKPVTTLSVSTAVIKMTASTHAYHATDSQAEPHLLQQPTRRHDIIRRADAAVCRCTSAAMRPRLKKVRIQKHHQKVPSLCGARACGKMRNYVYLYC